MASYIAFTTIGVKIGYAMEVESGGLTKHPNVPTTGWKHIKGLKGSPNFNQETGTFDTTTYENKESESVVSTLKPAPSGQTFTAILSQGFSDDWDKLVSACETAKEQNKRMYYVIYIPNYTKAQYFSGYADELMFPELPVNSGIEIDVHIDQDGGEAFTDTAPDPTTGWASDGE